MSVVVHRGVWTAVECCKSAAWWLGIGGGWRGVRALRRAVKTCGPRFFIHQACAE